MGTMNVQGCPAEAVAPIVNIAAYKFIQVDQLQDRRRSLKETCLLLGLKGTILLSREGINLFLAGSRQSIDDFLNHLTADPLFADIAVKESYSDYQPFNRLLVRLKKEIIAFGVEGIDPSKETSPKLSPKQLKQWLDDGKPVTLLDTRNDYEVQLGTFSNATDLKLDHFRNFPQAVRNLPEEVKEKPVVIFCTGGIRCEKAGPLMLREGFREVYQLDGGILKYFEECGGNHWTGECFVFDKRVALDPQLRETPTKECFKCRAALTVQDQESPHYIPGESCPHCFEDPATKMHKTIQRRQRTLAKLCDPLPGSTPYDNRRPVSVPERLDRLPLLDVLDTLHPHVGRDEWKRLCDEGQILYKDAPASADKIVRSGEVYERLFPNVTEPDVNANIQILYEDNWLVAVNKPAPLPMHPCGRFHRNTLQYLLNEVYAPHPLRAAHRLDANTSGVVVLCRTRKTSALVQPQFERREVSKIYVARVHGRPMEEEFVCETRIGLETVQTGVRLPDPDGVEARTEFRLLKSLPDGTSLVEARPITGRTNQIRLHLWDLGLSIHGDPVFLPGRQLGDRQTLTVDDSPLCLHAHRIELTHPSTNARITFEAPLPDWAQ